MEGKKATFRKKKVYFFEDELRRKTASNGRVESQFGERKGVAEAKKLAFSKKISGVARSIRADRGKSSLLFQIKKKR